MGTNLFKAKAEEYGMTEEELKKEFLKEVEPLWRSKRAAIRYFRETAKTFGLTPEEFMRMMEAAISAAGVRSKIPPGKFAAIRKQFVGRNA